MIVENLVNSNFRGNLIYLILAKKKNKNKNTKSAKLAVPIFTCCYDLNTTTVMTRNIKKSLGD